MTRSEIKTGIRTPSIKWKTLLLSLKTDLLNIRTSEYNVSEGLNTTPLDGGLRNVAVIAEERQACLLSINSRVLRISGCLLPTQSCGCVL